MMPKCDNRDVLAVHTMHIVTMLHCDNHNVHKMKLTGDDHDVLLMSMMHLVMILHCDNGDVHMTMPKCDDAEV